MFQILAIYVFNRANATPRKTTGINSKKPPVIMNQTTKAGKTIRKRTIAIIFVRLHVTLITKPNTFMNSHINKAVQVDWGYKLLVLDQLCLYLHIYLLILSYYA